MSSRNVWPAKKSGGDKKTHAIWRGNTKNGKQPKKKERDSYFNAQRANPKKGKSNGKESKHSLDVRENGV